MKSKILPGVINLYQCGHERCEAGHSFGPHIRSHNLIHYVISGKGVFEIDGKTYELTKNHIFYIPKDVVTYYRADAEQPWHYAWVEFDVDFNGTFKFSRELPCLEPDPAISPFVNDMVTAIESSDVCGLYLSACALKILSFLVPKQSKNYVENIKQYIDLNIHRRITINELSSIFKLDRTYIYTLFKKSDGISPMDFILNARMQRACHLLRNTDLTIKEISNSVGYDDQLVFSRMFKNKLNYSPKHYREHVSTSV